MTRGKADVHIHTKYSGLTRILFFDFPDSLAEPKDIVSAAEKRGLNAICITDHNTLRGAMQVKAIPSSVEVIVSEEVSSTDGEILALFVTEEIPPGLTAAETIDRIHAQGALAVAPHPMSAHCKSLCMKMEDLHLDGVEVLNASHRDGFGNRAAAELSNGLDIAKIGGSDAHSPMMVGNAYTVFDGVTGEDLRKAITQRQTMSEGRQTTLREMVWMLTGHTAYVQRAIARSLLGLPMPGKHDVDPIIDDMRTITKILSLVATTAFLTPPVPALAGFVGDRVYSSMAKSMVSRLPARSPKTRPGTHGVPPHSEKIIK
jgi:predicted metal-dependent phosphoesterase TrpH